MVLLLKLVCVADVLAELEDESSPNVLEDVEKWIVLISVVDVTNDNICEDVGCETILLNSAGLCRTIADEKAEELVNTMLDGEINKIDSEEGLLNSTELCGTIADEVADNPRDKIVVDGNTGSNVRVGVVPIDNRVVDVAIEKIAELAKDVAVASIVEEAMESTVEIVEKLIEESGVEAAIDCRVELGDGVTEIEEVASIVGPAIVEMVAIIEDDVGAALVELVETVTSNDVARIVDRTVSAEDGEGTALEGRLSVLMMSAAFTRV